MKEENGMMYRLPELEDKALLDAYVQEHFRCCEKSISASMGLAGAAYFEASCALMRTSYNSLLNCALVWISSTRSAPSMSSYTA